MTEEHITTNFKVAAEFTYADTVERATAPMENSEGTRRLFELIGRDAADAINDLQLLVDWNLVQLGHALVTERNLEDALGTAAESLVFWRTRLRLIRRHCSQR